MDRCEDSRRRPYGRAHTKQWDGGQDGYGLKQRRRQIFLRQSRRPSRRRDFAWWTWRCSSRHSQGFREKADPGALSSDWRHPSSRSAGEEVPATERGDSEREGPSAKRSWRGVTFEYGNPRWTFVNVETPPPGPGPASGSSYDAGEYEGALAGLANLASRVDAMFEENRRGCLRVDGILLLLLAVANLGNLTLSSPVDLLGWTWTAGSFCLGALLLLTPVQLQNTVFRLTSRLKGRIEPRFEAPELGRVVRVVGQIREEWQRIRTLLTTAFLLLIALVLLAAAALASSAPELVRPGGFSVAGTMVTLSSLVPLILGPIAVGLWLRTRTASMNRLEPAVQSAQSRFWQLEAGFWLRF